MIPDQELTSKIIGEAIKRSKNTLNKKELIDIVLYKQRQLEICVDEIKKLNDIINELEKCLEEQIKISQAHDNQLGVNVGNTFKNKLNELKGDSSNG